MSNEELQARLERGREIWRENQVEIKELHSEVARLRGACAEKDKQIEGLEQLAGSQQTGNTIHFRLAFGSASRRSPRLRELPQSMKDKLKPYAYRS